MADLSKKSLIELRSKWKSLSALDRAIEVDKIRGANISGRSIATGLGCGESSLRHIQFCLEASAEDQDLARQKKISINELVRGGKAAKAKRMAPPPEVVEAQRKESASKGADLICNWLDGEGFNQHHKKIIIGRAREVLEQHELNRCLPQIPKHPPIAPALIISRTKPKRPCGKGVALIDWHTDWLVRWAPFVVEDLATMHMALGEALKRQK